MIKFKINKEQLKVLTAIGSQLKDMASQTKTIFFPKEGSMSINLYSVKNAVTYSIGIEDFSSDDGGELDFFSLTLPDLCSVVEKVSEHGEHDINVLVDKLSNGITFSNIDNDTKIKLATFNSTVSDDDAKSSITAVDSLYKSFFENASLDITINNNVMVFYDTAQKFMNLTKRANAIALNHNKARYADNLAVIEKDLGDDVSPYDTDTYIKKALIDFIRPLMKLSGAESQHVYLTSNSERAYIDMSGIGLKAVLALEASSYSYPEKDELEAVLPESSRCITVDTTKAELKKAFSIFDGRFKASNWAWENIHLDSSKEFLSNGKIRISHSDYSAECDTSFAVTLQNNTENSDKAVLIGSRQVFSYLLDLIESDKEPISLTFNSLTPSDPHGMGIGVTTESGLSAMAIKLIDNE